MSDNKTMDFDLIAVCKWIIFQELSNDNAKKPLNYVLAQKVINGVSEEEEEFIRAVFLESNVKNTIDKVTTFSTPLQDRKWGRMYRRVTEYNPFDNVPEDCTELYDFETHFIYIHSECKAKWGDSYWISDNCSNTLKSLPVIKAFKEYDFQVGKFYKLQCIDVIEWGGNKKKYIFKIEESNEEEFMELGFRLQAMDERKWHKYYMQQMMEDYSDLNKNYRGELDGN